MSYLKYSLVGFLFLGAGFVLFSLQGNSAIPKSEENLLTKTTAQFAAPTAVISPERQKFREELDSILSELPTNQDVKRNSHGDSHHSPRELGRAATLIAGVRQGVRENPELIPDAIQFFDRCARLEDVQIAVGSVCLRHLQNLAVQANVKLDLSRYAPEFVKLSQEMSFAR